MIFIRKYLYIFYFVLLFLLLSVGDYFKKGNWDLRENFFYSLFATIVYAFITWAWDSKKYEKK
ncbi:hypothetical protein ABIA69_000795 [Lysinibacillus parviboronicapiens]|uniref:Uncharacterized protein n=1 Tax=Lysinibacillus parviboronicapiens TaxID=436516 RepID=A0ABV2PFD5_9BACI